MVKAMSEGQQAEKEMRKKIWKVTVRTRWKGGNMEKTGKEEEKERPKEGNTCSIYNI
jgi:hypothetical protein